MLAYLRATSTIGLRYKGEVPGMVPSVVGMCDASFAMHEGYASQSGFYFTLCGAAISWKSNKIRKIVLSSTEAEYVAASDASRQAEYHRNVLVELGLFSGGAVQVQTDNKGVQALVGDPVQRQRTKHIGSHSRNSVLCSLLLAHRVLPPNCNLLHSPSTNLREPEAQKGRCVGQRTPAYFSHRRRRALPQPSHLEKRRRLCRPIKRSPFCADDPFGLHR